MANMLKVTRTSSNDLEKEYYASQLVSPNRKRNSVSVMEEGMEILDQGFVKAIQSQRQAEMVESKKYKT